jgi:acyl transferase domain-containing protein
MEERVGFIANSLEQLVERLHAYLDGARDTAGTVQGQVRKDRENIAFLTQDAEVQESIIVRWLARRQLTKLAELWARGLDLDWNRLYGGLKPRRIAVPTYPFAKERYWIGIDAVARTHNQTPAKVQVLHPFLHVNVSDLETQAYRSTFTGEEPFLRDHRVRTDGGTVQKVLPGVVCLEMVRAALADALKSWPGSLELHDVVWMRPVVVADRKTIFISLAAHQDQSAAAQVDYRIYSTDGGQEIVHCRGRAMFNTRMQPTTIDIARLRNQMSAGELEPEEIYAAFERTGLHYGPAHRAISVIWREKDQVLAKLRLPPHLESSMQEYLLHPSMMDSAVQALIGLTEDLRQLADEPFVPFALEHLHVLQGCAREMFAWVRNSPGRSPHGRDVKSIDIDVCDEQGKVCVLMRGLAGRILQQATTYTEVEPIVPVTFDSRFYQAVIDRIVNKEISVEEAIRL